MPSFKKVLKAQRTPHRERGQLRERKQFGFLQKKKDYKIRAERAREKQKKIKQLHQEALDRNPDEFFYKMITQTKQVSYYALVGLTDFYNAVVMLNFCRYDQKMFKNLKFLYL